MDGGGRARKKRGLELPLDPVESAKAAGLRYVTGEGPGIRRKRAGSGFSYVDAQGKTLRDKETLDRIRSLAIPPAYQDVWICPSPQGHIQAVGRDDRGRKQYRYHPLYRAVRDHTKFARMLSFGEALPAIRKRVNADLARQGLAREKVLAAVVKLLDTTSIRVGNEEYVKENASYGLTTLRNRHVRVKGASMHFHFRGKSGQEHEIDLQDRRLASIVKRLQDLPGHELFQYEGEDGDLARVTSEDVNDYIREVAGEEFTAKDFRTWAGTGHTVAGLYNLGKADSDTAAKRNIVAAVKETAKHLGNRPATCRNYYVHPAVLDAYVDGSLFELMAELTVVVESQEPCPHDVAETCVRRLVEKYTVQATAGAGTLKRLFGSRRKAS